MLHLISIVVVISAAYCMLHHLTEWEVVNCVFGRPDEIKGFSLSYFRLSTPLNLVLCSITEIVLLLLMLLCNFRPDGLKNVGISHIHMPFNLASSD